MGKIAFAFPGIGVKLCGREAGFFDRHRALMAPFLTEASDAACTDLVAALTDDNVPSLGPRAKELFVHAFNCGAHAVYRQFGLEASCMAGYSLGEADLLRRAAGIRKIAPQLAQILCARRRRRRRSSAGTARHATSRPAGSGIMMNPSS